MHSAPLRSEQREWQRCNELLTCRPLNMWIVDAEEVEEAVRSVLQSSGVGEWRTGGEGRGGEAAREKRSGNGGRRDINCQSSHHIWMEQCTNYSAVRASLHRTALHCIALHCWLGSAAARELP